MNFGYEDVAEEGRFERLCELLDHDTSPWRAGIVPPLGHWLCFLPRCRQSRLGLDGHPGRSGDGLFPPEGLPRRMWAGSRVRFLQDIPLGATMLRRTRILSQVPKEGHSGRMLFVTLAHEITTSDGTPSIVEEQDLVYREPADTIVREALPVQAARLDVTEEDPGALMRVVAIDAVAMFRYSALTYNAHRIHYDRSYAREIEGYSGLVVHGPLIATLLLDAVLREQPRSRVGTFNFRARSPVYDSEPMRLFRNGDDLVAASPRGIAMTAECRIDR